MESIKASVRKASEFLQSLIFPSHTTLDEPLADETFKSEVPVIPSPLENLSLSPRVFNCLWKADVRNIETVISMSDENLLNIRGFGVKALTELKGRLAIYRESGREI